MTSFCLHIIAMAFMFLDHLWGCNFVQSDIFTCIGRIAFPIFAFMAVEGYFKTSNLKRYLGRLFIFALLSEIPYNLMIGSAVFYPISQNVLWTFLIGLSLIWLVERVKNKHLLFRGLMAVLVIFLGFIIGLLLMPDYHYPGVLTVLVFYFFKDKKWYNLVFQMLCLWYINTEMLGGLEYLIPIGDYTFNLLRQSLAVLSLVPIWVYNGKQGYYNKYIKYFYYFFYPIHMLILGLLK